jgi:hypothetical protein
VVGVSGAKEYSVKPVLLVSTVTPAIVAVFTVLADAAAGLLAGLLAVLLAGEGEAPAELHATSAAAAAAAAGSASSIRRRARPLRLRGALPLPPRPGIFRGVILPVLCVGVSVPGWPDGVGGDDCLVGAAGSANGIRGNAALSAWKLTCLFVFSSLRFLVGNWHRRQIRKLC